MSGELRCPLGGVITVLAMPFAADGGIDEADLAREAAWAVSVGVDGVALALASELPRLTVAERAAATAVVVAAVDGRVPVVVHAGAESATVAIELALAAEALGASAVMVPPPTFEVGGPRARRAFFDELAAATSLAIVLQDIPAARLGAAEATSLADAYPGRIALKVEVPPITSAVADAVQAADGRLPVFGGAAGLLLPSELLRGAAGTMPGCVLPEAFVEVWRRFSAGDRDGARRAFARIVPFLAATLVPGRLIPFYREALVIRGVFAHGRGRTPDGDLDDLERAELRALLDDLALPPAGA